MLKSLLFLFFLVERYVKRALETEHLSVCRGSVAEPGGKPLFWGL
jgi:hypothetical protein